MRMDKGGAKREEAYRRNFEAGQKRLRLRRKQVSNGGKISQV